MNASTFNIGLSTSLRKLKTLPLLEQMTAVRCDIDAIDAKDYIDLTRATVGAFKQAYTNCLFWYNQWDKNRDYSSSVNASMALGKLLTANDLMQHISGHRSDEMNELREAVAHIASEAWDNIQKASGRIVPFE